MHFDLIWALLVVILTSTRGHSPASVCDQGYNCFCDTKRLPDDLVGLKVNCHPVKGVDLDLPRLLPPNTYHLDLAKYGMTELVSGMFSRAGAAMRKLDLQNNAIAYIDEGVFVDMGNLEVLDLSMNNLEVITMDMFEGLKNLDRLKLNDNRLQTIESGAFSNLPSLSKVDLSENPFICDCNLAWFIQWIEDNKAKILNSAKVKCALPIDLAEVSLRKVDPQQLVCAEDVQFPGSHLVGQDNLQKISTKGSRILGLKPEESQVVFEGDPFKATCHVETSDPKEKISWLVRGQPFKNLTVVVTSRSDTDLESAADVGKLTLSHSGKWTCLLTSSGARRSINLLVMTRNTKVCPPVVTSTPRGHYSWSPVIAGVTLQQTCQKAKSSSSGFGGLAFYHCHENGVWSSTMNASQCGYTSEVTDNLHKFATMDTSFTEQHTLLSSALQFVNFTNDPKKFEDEMDVVFFARAIENYIPYLHDRIGGIELGRYMMSMIANLFEVKSNIISKAQMKDRSCSRLLQTVNNVTLTATPFQHHTNKLAVESRDLQPASVFGGVTCTWYMGSGNLGYDARFPSKKVFHCADTNLSVPSKEKIVLASVSVPKTIYEDLHKRRKKRQMMPEILVFAAFANVSLFPTPESDEKDDFQFLNSAVIGASYYGRDLNNLSDPVTIALRLDKEYENPLDIQPVWWDSKSNDGFGAWNPNVCVLSSLKSRSVWFKCNRLGFYSCRVKPFSSLPRNHFRLHHPLIYVGSAVCFVLLLASVVIYALSYPFIRVSSELKHAFMNMWVAMLSLIFIFCIGIRQVEHLLTCQLVGILSHYLTLCNLVWILLSVHIIYSKTNSSRQRQMRRPPGETLLRPRSASSHGNGPSQASSDLKPKKSILRYYLVSWGLCAIICCISVAIKLDSYDSHNFCFLTLTPFLVTIIFPGAVITALLVGFSLSAWCLVSSAPSHVTEQFEQNRPSEAHSNPDKEKTVRSLLLSHAYIYLLFLSTWMCGSLAVVRPLQGDLPHDEVVFAGLFTVSAISLGVFIFVYFCASRHDVQECWRSPLCAFVPSNESRLNVASEQITPFPTLQHQETVFDPFVAANAGFPPSEFGAKQSEFGGSQEQYQFPAEGPYGVRGSSLGEGFRNYSRLKDINNGVKKSNKDSDDDTLNNVLHLRRGYVAPVNSEAEFYALHPKRNHEFKVPPPPPSLPPPMTSSPVGGSNVPLRIDQDMTISPLNSKPKVEENEDELEYTESSTIKVGAPCQLASLTAADLPPVNLSKNSTNKKSGNQRRAKRHNRRASKDEDEDDEENSSKVSSNYSSGHNHHRGKRRRKRPKAKQSGGESGRVRGEEVENENQDIIHRSVSEEESNTSQFNPSSCELPTRETSV